MSKDLKSLFDMSWQKRLELTSLENDKYTVTGIESIVECLPIEPGSDLLITTLTYVRVLAKCKNCDSEHVFTIDDWREIINK